MFCGKLRWQQFVGDLDLQADTQNALKQIVVQLLSYSRSFAYTLFEASLQRCGQLPHPHSVSTPCADHENDKGNDSEPLGLVESGQQFKLQSRSCFVPEAVIVRGQHSKPVLART